MEKEEKFQNNEDILNLESKFNKLNADKLIIEAINSVNNNNFDNANDNINKIKQDNFEFLTNLENKSILNYLKFLEKNKKDESKEQFYNEINKFKNNANIEINKKEILSIEYVTKYNSILEKNKILNKQLYEFSNRFSQLEKNFKEKEIEILQLKEKLKLFKDNEKLFISFKENFYDKNPLDIMKSYKEKNEYEFNLVKENSELKEIINKLRSEIDMIKEQSTKKIKYLNNEIDALFLEKKDILEKEHYKLSDMKYIIKKNSSLQEQNNFLHKMLYQIYNKLIESFKLDKNIDISKKFTNLQKSDFTPDIYDDEELGRYINIMITTSKPSLCDQLLREIIANANMVLRLFLKNKINLNLRFDPVNIFKELKSFMEQREDKIKNLESLIQRYKALLNNKENKEIHQKKYIMKCLNKEKHNLKVDKSKSKSCIEELIYSEDNNDNSTNYNKIKNNQTIELTSTKNNTNENNTITIQLRPNSFSPLNKSYKTITNIKYNQNKKINFYKDSKYQLINSMNSCTNKINDITDINNFKKIKKIKINKKGNLIKENGSQQLINSIGDFNKFISHTRRLLFYRSKISPNNKFKSFSFNRKNNLKISKENNNIEKILKKKIIGKINKLINDLDITKDKKESKKKKENKKKQEVVKNNNNKNEEKKEDNIHDISKIDDKIVKEEYETIKES